jgi:hypothetical protein
MGRLRQLTFLYKFPNRLLTVPAKTVESNPVSPLGCPNHSADGVHKSLRNWDPKHQFNNIVSLQLRHFYLDSAVAQVAADPSKRLASDDTSHLGTHRHTRVFPSILHTPPLALGG